MRAAMHVSGTRAITWPRSQASLAPAPDDHERLFVYASWAALTAALVAFVLRYGSDVPWMDDWELVPVLSGARPVTAAWLWIQQNEHRFPVTRALLVAAGAVTGGDFRAGMLASVVLLSAAALAAIRAAARLRGRASYTDALFPLLLLHPGHGHNVLGHIQLFFVSAWALVIAVVLLVAGDRCTRSTRSAAGLAACLWLLPLHSAAGALFAPWPAVWALHAGRQARRWEQRRRAGAVLMAGGAGALVLAGVYFIGLVRPHTHPPSPSLAASAIAAGQVVGVSLGPFGEQAWPWATVGVGLLAAATVFRLALTARTDPGERTRALGLLVVACTVAGILAGTGVARAGFGPRAGFQARYALMGAPLLVAASFTWTLYGGAGRLVNTLLFTVASVAFSVNVQHGLAYGRTRKADADALTADVRDGVPPMLVARRHSARFYPAPQIMARRLRMLHAAGQGPYRGLPRPAARPPCQRWEPFAPQEAGTHHLDWRDGIGRPRGRDPWVVFVLGDAERLCALRLTVVQTASGPLHLPVKVYWALAEKGWFSERRQSVVRLATGAQPQRLVVWINEDVDLLRVDPDERVSEFRITRMEVLSGT
jgi:hypothetical protein